MSGPTVEFKVHFRTGARGRKRVRQGARPAPPEVKPGRVPRVARVMAMAIRFDRLVQEGLLRSAVRAVEGESRRVFSLSALGRAVAAAEAERLSDQVLAARSLRLFKRSGA